MNHLAELEFKTEFGETIIDLPLIILKTKSDAFKNISDLYENRKLLNWYDQVNDSREIKTILFIGEKNTCSENNYDNFISRISGIPVDELRPEKVMEKLTSKERAIEITMLSNYALKFFKMNKVLITCWQGEIVTPFFGLSLLSDLRFAGENMCYSLCHGKYGIHPSGFLPLLLPKYIGLGRSMKYLMSESKISAQKGLELGLISKIFPEEGFMESCIEEAKRISTHSPNVISTTRKLVYNFERELSDYIKREAEFIHR